MKESTYLSTYLLTYLPTYLPTYLTTSYLPTYTLSIKDMFAFHSLTTTCEAIIVCPFPWRKLRPMAANCSVI